MSELQEQYQNKIKKQLAEEFSIKNPMALPKLQKIVINVGLGEAVGNKNVIENMMKQLADIAGQKPVTTYSKRDISSFKLRRGDAIGMKVTLRSKRMYDFFEKLVKIVLPRIRDFRGVPKTSFDKRGNYSLGLSEQIVFPEIDYSKIDKIRGLEIIFITSTTDSGKSMRLLELMGMPFMKK